MQTLAHWHGTSEQLADEIAYKALGFSCSAISSEWSVDEVADEAIRFFWSAISSGQSIDEVADEATDSTVYSFLHNTLKPNMLTISILFTRIQPRQK